MSESKGLQINWLSASGSALGAVTSAVLLSTLGAAGTLIGAALGSLIITVGGSIYSYSLQRAKTGIEKTAERVKIPGRGADKAKTTREYAPISATSAQEEVPQSAHTESVGADVVDDAVKPSWKQTLRGMPWKRVAALAAGLFAVTMVIILVFELSTGRPVSSYTGGSSSDVTGTTFSSLTGRGGGESPGTDSPGPGQQDSPERAPERGENQDVEQPQQYEEPAPQQEPAPEQAPEPAVPEPAVPEPQPEEPAPEQEQAPQEAPAE